MSDLISRSALIERIKLHRENVKSGSCNLDGIYGLAHEHIIELVEQQPTTYDVEKVVAELEAMEEKAIKVKNITVSSYACGMMHKAIDIVKRGGLDGKE